MSRKDDVMKNINQIFKVLIGGLISLFVFTFFNHAFAQTCISPPAGLVSWWPGQGNADDVIGGNHGILEGGTGFTPGIVGQAFILDGVDDFVLVPEANELDGFSQLTIDAWINFNAFATDPENVVAIAAKYAPRQSYYLAVRPPGVLQLKVTQQNCCVGLGDEISAGMISNDPVIPIGEFVHVAGVWRGGTDFELYVNGVQVPGTLGVLGANFTGMANSDSPILVGAFGDLLPGDSIFGHADGIIDEVEVYNRALSASEILAIFQAGSAGKCKVADADGDGVPDSEDACPNTPGFADLQGCPVGDSNLVDLHIVDQAKTGACNSSGTCDFPIEGAQVRVFDRNDQDFQATYGTKNPDGSIYDQIFENDIGRVGSCITKADGACTAGEETIGDYLVIVKFIDSETGKIVYTGKPKSPEDFASEAPSSAYVINRNSNDVSVINTVTNTVIATIPVGALPQGVAVTPDASEVYVSHADARAVFIIDTPTNTVVDVIGLPNRSQEVEITPDGAKAIVVVQDGNAVAVIDTATRTVTNVIGGFNSPHGIGITHDGTKAYVTNFGVGASGTTVSVIDIATNTIIATIPVGQGPVGVAVTPDGTKVYVANNVTSTVSVIKTATNTVIATLPTVGGSFDMEISPDGTTAFVTGNPTTLIDTATDTVISSFPLGAVKFAFTSDGTKIYAPKPLFDVNVIEVASGTLIATIPVGENPIDVAITPEDLDGDGIGDVATKDFQVIKVLRKDGLVQFSGGSKTVVIGSMLEIIHPDYAIWEEGVSSYVYPFIMTSDSDWTVDVCAEVPIGYRIVGIYDENGDFVSSGKCAHTFVAGETRVIAFEVVDIGSPPPHFKGRFTVRHDGKVYNFDLDTPGYREGKDKPGKGR